jgi:NADPH:quinone reductase-like Zn-dependent oxidoreductase
LGADARRTDIASMILGVTDGRRCDVVFDLVGRQGTFANDLEQTVPHATAGAVSRGCHH